MPSKGLVGHLIHARRQKLDKCEVFARTLQRVSCRPIVKRALHLDGMSTIGPCIGNSVPTTVDEMNMDSTCCKMISVLLFFCAYLICSDPGYHVSCCQTPELC